MSKNGEMFKITVMGDVMSEPPVFEQSKTENGYDYNFIFKDMKPFLDKADYVIANLETPIAGEEAGYTKELVSFNAPDEMVQAVKNAGIKLVTTANNHALDRGVAGLERTIDVLDKYGIAHTGTFKDPSRPEPICYFKAGDATVAVISYTYDTNMDINRVHLTGKEQRRVNYLLPPDCPPHRKDPLPPKYYTAWQLLERIANRPILWEERVMIRRMLDITVAYGDDIYDEEKFLPYLEHIKEDYALARKNADIVLFMPHVGGQFNTEPAAFSQRVVDEAVKLGFDGVIAAHSHTTQRATKMQNSVVYYSLGNVTMSPNSVYPVMESLPEYGILAHMYIKDKKIVKNTYSLFKIVEKKGEQMRVIMVDDLYKMLETEEEKQALKDDVSALLCRINGQFSHGGDIIAREYDLT